MCGIAGILNFHSEVAEGRIKKMTDAIMHRGPDSEGSWKSENGKIALGHRRLSIIDLSEKGIQPMHFAQRYTITFNGEIYNYIELRDNLKSKGYIFSTETDTEVILAAYHEYKENCLSYFDGMFAFALWDNQTETLFCARDRFGEKPFFYHYNKENSFRFASEMKSLWTDGVKKDINNKMLFYFLAYDVVENPFDKSETFFNNIFRLEAAHYLLVKKDGSLIKKRYWDIDLSKKSDLSFEDATIRFQELFERSVTLRLHADVPVGSSLSGGLDSSAVVCYIDKLRKDKTHDQNTFTARFHDEHLDEGKYVDEVERVTNIKRHEVFVDEDSVQNDMSRLFAHQEEPMGGPSPLAQWCVMRLAKERNVTVLLDGQGADETLGGYLHFFHPFFNELYLTNKGKFVNELNAYKKLRGKAFPVNMNFKLQARYSPFFRTLGRIRRKISMPDYLSFMDAGFLHSFKNEPPPFETFNSLNESLKYFTTVYGLEKLLRYSDRSSMAFSREVRLPFLSHELVEFLFSLPAGYKIHEGWTKYLLRVGAQHVLPPKITWRVSKLGFEPPLHSWLKSPKVIQQVNESTDKIAKLNIVKKGVPFNDKEWKMLELAHLY